MKKITQLLFLLILASTFSFCKVKKYTPVDYPKGQIIFGSGGGFAGTVTEYVLLENGQLFTKKSLEGEYQNVKKLERNVVKQMFNNISFLKIEEVELNEPGNMYYYLQIKNKNSDHRIVWGGSQPAPKEIKNFYNTLNYLCKGDKR